MNRIGEVYMKEKIKKIVLGYLPGFITGIVVCGGVSVIAVTFFPSNQVTYENGTSGMQASDVQGAIDELYLTCTAEKVDVGGKDVIVVNSGDGLYADEYEEGKYTYKGANPNNYVTFNNETAGWRIISINSDGTIKIMRDADINTSNTLAWDTSNSNNWNRPATLNTYLNGDYYNSLSSTAQSQIVEATYYAGEVTYNNDMQDQISDEKVTTSKVKVALPTVSEYIRANSNKEQCGTFSLNENNYSTCKNSDWMLDSSINNWWTLSPRFDYSSSLFRVYIYGFTDSGPANGANTAVRPAITLSSKVQITGGTGTESDPYILS